MLASLLLSFKKKKKEKGRERAAQLSFPFGLSAEVNLLRWQTLKIQSRKQNGV